MPLDLAALRADMHDRYERGVDDSSLSARTVREILDRAIAAEAALADRTASAESSIAERDDLVPTTDEIARWLAKPTSGLDHPKIDALKMYRARTNRGLTESKSAFDRYFGTVRP